jgi:fermentation-respiration switch protein FrsA (DUF1100 family)
MTTRARQIGFTLATALLFGIAAGWRCKTSAARRVLLFHGELDHETRPEHSRRAEAALAGPKRLILVPGARHGESLRSDVWPDIERWIDRYVGASEE